LGVTKVAPGVWAAGTRFVHWYLLDGGEEGLTLIDCGLPGYHRQLDPALRAIGRRRGQVRAVVLTHGHIDHSGTANRLAAGGAAVYMHPDDRPLAEHPSCNRTDRPLRSYLWWPATAAFVGHCLLNGALRPPPMPPTYALHDAQVVDVPGQPAVTHTPGHTDGSCVLEFRNHGVVFVGDLLCTVDPFSGRHAEPQLQSRASNRSSEQAMQSLPRLSGIDAQLVLPGHGSPWRDGIEAAVTSARRIGCR
jgi:glyoxylase-like metal-dependent hydrolase (beta-lactamase superfamily II)